MKSTNSGILNPITGCELIIPIPNVKGLERFPGVSGQGATQEFTLVMDNLPELSDSKSAVYNGETIMGRSAPLYTYSHSADRTISFQIHLYVIKPGDADRNIQILRIIQSAIYPRESDMYPYIPPPVCRIKCGSLLSTEHLCVVLQSYNVKFDTSVAWETNESASFCPFKLDIDTTWLTVYSSEDMPYQNKIITIGR